MNTINRMKVYLNDNRLSDEALTACEVLSIDPKNIYIRYLKVI